MKSRGTGMKLKFSMAFVALCVAGTAKSLAADGVIEPRTSAEFKSWLELRNKALAENPEIAFDPYSVLIRFKAEDKEVDPADKALIEALGGTIIESLDFLPGLVRVSMPLPAEDAVKLLEDVFGDRLRYATVDHVTRISATPNDPSLAQQFGLNNTGQTIVGARGQAAADINAFLAWDTFTGSDSMRIGVLDTGILATHQDLAANVWVNPSEVRGNGIDDDGNGTIDDVQGYNYVYRNANPADDHGHGSHVSGIIGASGNNGVGIAGVNWRCKIVPLKVFNLWGSGTESDCAAAIAYCVRNGIRVSNHSYGFPSNTQVLNDAIASANAAGHLLVCAAGNAAWSIDSYPSYPASNPSANILTVASMDNRNLLSSFSSYGSNSVDIAAPGSDIYSCGISSNSSYVYMSGTSMATPFATGAAALVWAANPTMTMSQVRARIMSTVRPAPALNGLVATGGVLDLRAALVPTTVNTTENGVRDSFSLSNGRESASPRSVLVTACNGYFNLPRIDFDQYPGNGVSANNYFAHSFINQTASVRSATITLRIRAGSGGSETDVIRLGYSDGTSSQIRSFHNIQLSTVTGTSWGAGTTRTVVIDLAAVPTTAGTVNLISTLTLRRGMDVLVTDDSGVDYAQLRIVRSN